MRSINATLDLFASVLTENYESFIMPFEAIRASFKNNIPTISNFCIVGNFNLMGTTKPEFKSQNVVENNGKLYCLIRLTKLSSNPSRSISWDIDNFIIDCSNKEIRFEGACVPCVNYKKVIKIDKIELSDNYIGQYALKILTRYDENEQWEVQTIKRLQVVQ